MLYELRVYNAVPGKLPALNERFAEQTMGFFKKHGIGMLGFWTAEIGTSNQLTYILKFDSMADRETKWGAFQADGEWQEVRASTEKEGPLTASVRNTFLRTTAYSPEPKIDTNVQEMRVYNAMPGKLPALNDRFANHTTRLFERHGITNVGYWTEDVGTNNKLVYMLGYANLGDREKGWAAFRADPEWQKASAASEANGPLVSQSQSTILRPTSYSPK